MNITFNSLFWLQAPWHRLMQRAAQKRLPHALMLTGNQGVGKTYFAQHLAKWLLCQATNKQELAAPCTTCHSCQLFTANNHPDFMQVLNEGKSKQIVIAQIRELNQQLAQTPNISDKQVLLINPIDIMNINASNAFLKTLEEPAGNAHIILISQYYGAVLPTIKSRCQKLHLPCADTDSTHKWLTEQGYNQLADNQQALHHSANAPLQALDFLQQNGIQAYNNWENSLINWITHQANLQQTADAWGQIELSTVLNQLYSCLLGWGKFSLGVPIEGLSAPLTQLFKHHQLQISPYQQLQKRILEILTFEHQGIGNYNKTLLIESLLIQLQTICKIVKRENPA